QDDGRHTKLPQPRAKGDAALTAADDDGIGLAAIAEFGSLRLALFLPALPVLARAVFRAQWTGKAPGLLVALELLHGGQERPDPAVAQPDKAVAPGHPGLEGDPCGDDAVLFGGNFVPGQFPAGRLHRSKLR